MLFYSAVFFVIAGAAALVALGVGVGAAPAPASASAALGMASLFCAAFVLLALLSFAVGMLRRR